MIDIDPNGQEEQLLEYEAKQSSLFDYDIPVWIPIKRGERGYSVGDWRCSNCKKPLQCYERTIYCPNWRKADELENWRRIMLNREEYNATFYGDLSAEEFARLKPIVLSCDNIKDVKSITAVISNTLERVEFVQVVRCKDCKWFHEWKENGKPQGYGFCEMDGMKPHKDDWFCADGERKDYDDCRN